MVFICMCVCVCMCMCECVGVGMGVWVGGGRGWTGGGMLLWGSVYVGPGNDAVPERRG